MATYAIGDLQGCMAALGRLLDSVRFNPDRDKIWIVGDLVNRGPDSLAVLRYVKGLGDAAVTVLGNHDLHLLAIASGATQLRPKDTLHEVLAAHDREELMTWLRSLPLLHREGPYALVHAGLIPNWTLDRATTMAHEVMEVLQGNRCRDFLRSLYEQKVPDRWSDDLPGFARLGVITNVFTKLRICAADGTMNLSYKAEPQAIPAGYLPWFNVPGRLSADSTIVFGHWSALGLHLRDNLIGLDSGCVWGRHLTAMRLEDRQVFQVSCADTNSSYKLGSAATHQASLDTGAGF